MELISAEIYPFLQALAPDMTEGLFRSYKKGQTISRLDSESYAIIYILEGIVKVTATSYLGKTVLVDEVEKEEFCGHISRMRGWRFHCDIVAKTNCIVLELPDSVFHALMKQPEFVRYFYEKTSFRLYYMYKKMLAKRLFCLNEIVAYYISLKSRGDVFECDSMYSVCNNLNISRRGLYNSINGLIDSAILEKEADHYIIKDHGRLNQLGENVRRFFENDILQGL